MKVNCCFTFKKLTYWRSNVVELAKEITNTTKVHQTNSYMRLKKANELKIKLSQLLCLYQSDSSK